MRIGALDPGKFLYFFNVMFTKCNIDVLKSLCNDTHTLSYAMLCEVYVVLCYVL